MNLKSVKFVKHTLAKLKVSQKSVSELGLQIQIGSKTNSKNENSSMYNKDCHSILLLLLFYILRNKLFIYDLKELKNLIYL